MDWTGACKSLGGEGARAVGDSTTHSEGRRVSVIAGEGRCDWRSHGEESSSARGGALPCQT